ncbi:anhydro-N-acetylmuramic acid kinase [Sinisalibacter aestuarii]|uniref:Anhydro-N-acetylmuramic acid kinase n=1 Tax=Sinisalibacter aestuarii TaxID=2949426 RepID=A0ABQ5LUP5_9RHOB|nr:anhydro-N-acetylmuramic acid kinase [Sinisalibacter aestuarii]GKY87847.1 anhydro-N-acetylmuramic acid kinase [Sinisalibacter aestuarii]
MKVTGPVWALGAMPDSALGGVDAALVETDGVTILGFGESGSRSYTDAERETIRAALGCWPGAPGVEAAALVVEAAHAELLALFEAPALIGFFGQVLAHDPRGQGTHQAGDGARLAQVLGRPVAWDFATADVALGGEGAPLAPFFHFALAKYLGEGAPLAFLDLGEVASLSWVDPAKENPEEAGALLAFDTGPGLAPLNDLAMARRGLPFDEGGALAASGTADEGIVAAILDHPYFYRMPPKTLGHGAFGDLTDRVAGLSDADAAATLAACAVAAVVQGMAHCPEPPARLLVSGGGRHDTALMAGLANALAMPVLPVEEAGLDGDMLAAQAVAFLAVRVARGLPTSCPGTTGVAAAVGGGVISEPG